MQKEAESDQTTPTQSSPLGYASEKRPRGLLGRFTLLALVTCAITALVSWQTGQLSNGEPTASPAKLLAQTDDAGAVQEDIRDRLPPDQILQGQLVLVPIRNWVKEDGQVYSFNKIPAEVRVLLREQGDLLEDIIAYARGPKPLSPSEQRAWESLLRKFPPQTRGGQYAEMSYSTWRKYLDMAEKGNPRELDGIREKMEEEAEIDIQRMEDRIADNKRIGSEGLNDEPKLTLDWLKKDLRGFIVDMKRLERDIDQDNITEEEYKSILSEWGHFQSINGDSLRNLIEKNAKYVAPAPKDDDFKFYLEKTHHELLAKVMLGSVPIYLQDKGTIEGAGISDLRPMEE